MPPVWEAFFFEGDAGKIANGLHNRAKFIQPVLKSTLRQEEFEGETV
jgi:hypothetical protein